MNNFFIKNNLHPIQKICISGLFIAILIILNKVIAINYIPIIPFVRLTIGAGALAIFASFLLGPIYGGIVCGFADILGYLIFDPKTMGFFPTITLIYILLGVLPYFLFCFIRLIKNKKAMMIIEYSFLFLIFALVSLYLLLNDSINLYGSVYTFELYQKLIIIGVICLLFIISIIVNLVIDKKVNIKVKNYSIYHISFICFLTELIVFVLFGTLMKSIAFGFHMFIPILLSSGVIMFINAPLNTYLILITMRISDKLIIEGDKNV